MMKSLTRAQLLIAAILLPWAGSAHGQQCGVLTGLETRGLPRPKTHVNRYYLAAQGTTILSEDPVPVKDKGSPVRDVAGIVQYRGQIPDPAPTLTLQLHVVDTIERPIDQRQLAIVVDDSVRTEFGSMRVYRRNKPGDRKVDQSLTADIPSHPFTVLAYAHRAAFLVGDTEIELTPRHLEALRALYVAAVCGT
jgi:hypothetical protein